MASSLAGVEPSMKVGRKLRNLSIPRSHIAKRSRPCIKSVCEGPGTRGTGLKGGEDGVVSFPYGRHHPEKGAELR